MIMRSFIPSAFILSLFIVGCENGGKDTSSAKEGFDNDAEKMSYAIGVNIGGNVNEGMEQQGIDSVSAELIAQGLMDRMDEDKEALIAEDSTQQIIQQYMQKVQKRIKQENEEKGQEFLEEKASESDVEKTSSGLHYEVMNEGSGPKPDKWDSVRVHYHGTKLDGEVFDSSVDRGQPAEFPVSGGIVQGWTEALQLMEEGSKWKVYLPSDLAYGAQGKGQDIQPGEALVFEIELMEVIEVDSAEAAKKQQGSPGQSLTPAQQKQLQQQIQQQQQGGGGRRR